jgi:hypothetical protein
MMMNFRKRDIARPGGRARKAHLLQYGTYVIPSGRHFGGAEVAVWQASGVDGHAVGDAKDGLEALFRISDSHLLSDVAAFGIGAAMTTAPGVDVAAGAVTQFGSTRSQWPTWVLVHADAGGIHLFASDKKGIKGRELLVAAPGTYRATLHHALGQVQLLLFVSGQHAVTLRSRSGLRSRVPMRLARTVMEMAEAS